jgi:hypothetical protein
MTTAGGLQWRDHRSPRNRAARTIGNWPGTLSRHARDAAINNGSIIGSFSHDHAAAVWNDARAHVLNRAASFGEHIEPIADLEMITTLAAHLSGCSRCWRTGPYDADTPVQWLTWAVARRPRLRRILEPVLLELSGRRASGLATAPPLVR